MKLWRSFAAPVFGGTAVPTQVRVTPVAGKAIVVSGHDLKDLEELLKQTQGKGIQVYTHGGATPTGLDALDWAAEAAERGAGELLVTSMDRDGTRKGFDNILNRHISRRVNVPLVASGGAGEPRHFLEAFTEGTADAALAASVFHYGEMEICEVKNYLKNKGVEVRL